ncbi:hypothetical protein [Pyrobaculum neutrophilum]|uniref:Uncharacterized protein n=1 Tax=Pyrobaculum neutrophilum (strain DSM 2338 / JCM 9278 / NBRC 100436 / V24Sta) TaxID=444157 RepID=B1YCX8_PYRNV|nr:hypothetical protein [Pyrobaculum neutrophilum]ACB39641.1 conserved hypothetical protein [Pyrobaculum neutrophilum V24Sta]
MRQKVEQYFKDLEAQIDKDIEAFTVEWRQYEALAQIQLQEGLYVFIIFSWSDEDCAIEYMVGDENAVIQPKYIPHLEKALSIIKTADELARKRFTCLQSS